MLEYGRKKATSDLVLLLVYYSDYRFSANVFQERLYEITPIKGHSLFVEFENHTVEQQTSNENLQNTQINMHLELFAKYSFYE